MSVSLLGSPRSTHPFSEADVAAAGGKLRGVMAVTPHSATGGQGLGNHSSSRGNKGFAHSPTAGGSSSTSPVAEFRGITDKLSTGVAGDEEDATHTNGLGNAAADGSRNRGGVRKEAQVSPGVQQLLDVLASIDGTKADGNLSPPGTDDAQTLHYEYPLSFQVSLVADFCDELSSVQLPVPLPESASTAFAAATASAADTQALVASAATRAGGGKVTIATQTVALEPLVEAAVSGQFTLRDGHSLADLALVAAQLSAAKPNSDVVSAVDGLAEVGASQLPETHAAVPTTTSCVPVDAHAAWLWFVALRRDIEIITRVASTYQTHHNTVGTSSESAAAAGTSPLAASNAGKPTSGQRSPLAAASSKLHSPKQGGGVSATRDCFPELVAMDHILRVFERMQMNALCMPAMALGIRAALAMAGWGGLNHASEAILHSYYPGTCDSERKMWLVREALAGVGLAPTSACAADMGWLRTLKDAAFTQPSARIGSKSRRASTGLVNHSEAKDLSDLLPALHAVAASEAAVAGAGFKANGYVTGPGIQLSLPASDIDTGTVRKRLLQADQSVQANADAAVAGAGSSTAASSANPTSVLSASSASPANLSRFQASIPPTYHLFDHSARSKFSGAVRQVEGIASSSHSGPSVSIIRAGETSVRHHPLSPALPSAAALASPAPLPGLPISVSRAVSASNPTSMLSDPHGHNSSSSLRSLLAFGEASFQLLDACLLDTLSTHNLNSMLASTSEELQSNYRFITNNCLFSPVVVPSPSPARAASSKPSRSTAVSSHRHQSLPVKQLEAVAPTPSSSTSTAVMAKLRSTLSHMRDCYFHQPYLNLFDLRQTGQQQDVSNTAKVVPSASPSSSSSAATVHLHMIASHPPEAAAGGDGHQQQPQAQRNVGPMVTHLLSSAPLAQTLLTPQSHAEAILASSRRHARAAAWAKLTAADSGATQLLQSSAETPAAGSAEQEQPHQVQVQAQVRPFEMDPSQSPCISHWTWLLAAEEHRVRQKQVAMEQHMAAAALELAGQGGSVAGFE